MFRLPRYSLAISIAGLVLTTRCGMLTGADQAADELTRAFESTVKPFLMAHCNSCHSGLKPKGDLDLSPFAAVDAIAKDHKRWELVLERLRVGDMPPENAATHPSDDLRREIIAWGEKFLIQEGERHAGDPGMVPARRLSNAEYNYTIRDLTGVDLRPTQDFPVDPANEAGFDNSAESLSTSPALVKKYLDAARKVADHLALTPDGLLFAPHAVIAETDRDKFCVNRIVAFYQRQPTDYSSYFLAAWDYQARVTRDPAAVSLAGIAAEAQISEKYLSTVWGLLTGNQESVGPVAALQRLWNSIPEHASRAEAKAVCEQMESFISDLRPKLIPVVDNLKSPSVQDGSQPLVIWKNEQMAANHIKYASGSALKLSEWRLPPDSESVNAMEVPINAEDQQKYEAAFERFCRTFPDAFYVSERGRVFQNEASRGRLLSAGFHNQQGYFRDDAPLCAMVLDDAGQQELDRLWRDFDVITEAPQRQYRSFLWYERAESDFMNDEIFNRFRSEDKDSTTQAKLRELERIYFTKALNAGAGGTAQSAIAAYFRSMDEKFREIERIRRESEPNHIASLHALADKAFLQPLSAAEYESLTAFYRTLRDEGLSHEDAIRDGVVSILMSPHFLFRVNSPSSLSEQPAALSDYALASRLSYFLWASLPDDELLASAAAGQLHRPDELAIQAQRMLKDPKVRGMAVEFGGNWLDFRRFEEHNAVDRSRFPEFDHDLRQAMFEEPVRFFTDLAVSDRSVFDLLYGDYTFVNERLAKHYGIPLPEDVTTNSDGWYRIGSAGKYGRGGLLPMSVFLTKNAPGLRTSPVKRGYWVVKRLLGEHIPAPPADVPELPADESTSDLSLRDALAKHRENSSCASCHQRFDSLGLVFEGYGPAGEQRSQDLAGRPIETKAQFPDGSERDGLSGLATYLREVRQSDFIENLNRKLLAYALGRSLQLSDEKLLREMKANLAKSDYRFSTMVETIVTSPQFLHQRGRSASE